MNLYSKPQIEKEILDKLWGNAVLVFDSSALCSFYDLTPSYREKMISILEFFKDRMWLPYQVKAEYERNRVKAIHNPLKEKYGLPKFIKDDFVVSVREQVSAWEKSPFYHPYIDQEKIELIKETVEEANKHIRVIKETVEEQYKQRKEEIGKIVKDDSLETFVKTITAGEAFSFQEIMEIAKEGEMRYRNEIPPGYMDAKENKGNEPKEGFRKYGDLIIWKSILNYSRSNSMNVIFITNDMKEDWFHLYGDYKNLPRIELLSEFEEYTTKNIWIYNIAQFIDALKVNYQGKDPILNLYDDLDNVKYVLERAARDRAREAKMHGEDMVLCCRNCGHKFKVWSGEFDIDWECGGSSERSMGTDTTWLSTIETECPKCGLEIETYLQVEEYPEGAYNSGTIDCYGANILKEFDLSKLAPIYDDSEDDYDCCCHCGARAPLDEDFLCEDCRRELQRIINSED